MPPSLSFDKLVAFDLLFLVICAVIAFFTCPSTTSIKPYLGKTWFPLNANSAVLSADYRVFAVGIDSRATTHSDTAVWYFGIFGKWYSMHPHLNQQKDMFGICDDSSSSSSKTSADCVCLGSKFIEYPFHTFIFSPIILPISFLSQTQTTTVAENENACAFIVHNIWIYYIVFSILLSIPFYIYHTLQVCRDSILGHSRVRSNRMRSDVNTVSNPLRFLFTPIFQFLLHQSILICVIRVCHLFIIQAIVVRILFAFNNTMFDFSSDPFITSSLTILLFFVCDRIIYHHIFSTTTTTAAAAKHSGGFFGNNNNNNLCKNITAPFTSKLEILSDSQMCNYLCSGIEQCAKIHEETNKMQLNRKQRDANGGGFNCYEFFAQLMSCSCLRECLSRFPIFNKMLNNPKHKHKHNRNRNKIHPHSHPSKKNGHGSDQTYQYKYDEKLLKSLSLSANSKFGECLYYYGSYDGHSNGDRNKSDDRNRNSCFTMKEYFPTAFYEIRELFGISNQIFIDTFDISAKTKNKNFLLKFISNSKSGQYFFYSKNGKFLLKSLKYSELEFFKNVFKSYYTYVTQHPNSLINKFYAMYKLSYHTASRMSPTHQKTVIYFVIMESIFYSTLTMNAGIFDLKGSTKGRITVKPGAAKDKTRKESESESTEELVLKDLDFIHQQRCITIGSKLGTLFKYQLRLDLDFLCSLNIMDYSLLLGIHCKDDINRGGNKTTSSATTPKRAPKQDSLMNDSEIQAHLKKLNLFKSMDGGIVSSNEENNGGMTSHQNEVYFVGLIDILQNYNKRKKVENMMRRLSADQKTISCTNPKYYADRMYNFLAPHIV